MTDVERLQEVKKSAKWLHCFTGPVDVKSISEDMNWLIEQAERARELEKEKEFFRSSLVDVKANENVLEKENMRLREALEKIIVYGNAGKIISSVDSAVSAFARRALEQSK